MAPPSLSRVATVEVDSTRFDWNIPAAEAGKKSSYTIGSYPTLPALIKSSTVALAVDEVADEGAAVERGKEVDEAFGLMGKYRKYANP